VLFVECEASSERAGAHSASSLGVGRSPVRSTRCRTRISPRAKIAANELSRDSLIDHLTLRAPQTTGGAHGHREPRFRDNLKAWVARWRELADAGQVGSAAVANYARRQNCGNLAASFVGQFNAKGRVRRHESAPEGLANRTCATSSPGLSMPSRCQSARKNANNCIMAESRIISCRRRGRGRCGTRMVSRQQQL
jgi:hypothetical protein